MAKVIDGQIVLTDSDKEALWGLDYCKQYDHWINRLIGWKCVCDNNTNEPVDLEIKSIKEKENEI